MGPRLVDDPRKKHRLARLHPGQTRKWHPHLHLEIVSRTLPVLDSTMLLPDPAGFLRHLTVRSKFLLRHCHDEPINIRHKASLKTHPTGNDERSGSPSNRAARVAHEPSEGYERERRQTRDAGALPRPPFKRGAGLLEPHERRQKRPGAGKQWNEGNSPERPRRSRVLRDREEKQSEADSDRAERLPLGGSSEPFTDPERHGWRDDADRAERGNEQPNDEGQGLHDLSGGMTPTYSSGSATATAPLQILGCGLRGTGRHACGSASRPGGRLRISPRKTNTRFSRRIMGDNSVQSAGSLRHIPGYCTTKPEAFVSSIVTKAPPPPSYRNREALTRSYI